MLFVSGNFMRSDVYTLRDLHPEYFYKLGTLKEKITFLLRYAVLAPSTHNSQPWLFKIEDNSCKFFYNPRLKLPQGDPKQRDLFISMGCCLENFLIAGEYFKMIDKVEYVLKGNLVAEVFIKDYVDQSPDERFRDLVEAIPKRINYRGLFKNRSIDHIVVERIVKENNCDNLRVDVVIDEGKREEIALLTAQGLRIAHASPLFRREMSSWLHSSLSKCKDGMPGYSLRMPAFLSFIFPYIVRWINTGKFLSSLNYKSVRSAPSIFVFSIPAGKEGPIEWLNIGRVAERAMLRANLEGLRTSIFVASIEMDDLSDRLRKVLEINYLPQFLFCAGYMDHQQKPTPRYSVEEKLIQ